MATKFTAGPWSIDGQSLVHAADESRGGQRVTVAVTRHNPEANARLIAAAPELYESLLRLASLIEEVRDDSVSARMGFGATQAEKRERVRVLTGYIEANAEKLDEALDAAGQVLTKAVLGKNADAERVSA
jgi:hypothetical protein